MEWTNAILSALHHVPDTVWAALIAAGVAFFTATLSNRNSRKQLRMQLDSSATQQRLEREMALKRDVYLPTVEAVARIQGALGRLVDVNESQTEIARQMAADLATVLKAHLVASQATVTAIMNFTKVVMPAFLELTFLRAPFVNRKQLIALTQGHMDSALADHKALVQLMKQRNISGSSDSAAMERLQTQARNELTMHNKHADEQRDLFDEQNAGLALLGAKLGEILEKTSALLPEVLLSARRDLELPLDDAEYHRLSAEQQQAARIVMQDVQSFIETIRKGETK
jgi:hypothetical protein